MNQGFPQGLICTYEKGNTNLWKKLKFCITELSLLCHFFAHITPSTRNFFVKTRISLLNIYTLYRTSSVTWCRGKIRPVNFKTHFVPCFEAVYEWIYEYEWILWAAVPPHTIIQGTLSSWSQKMFVTSYKKFNIVSYLLLHQCIEVK